jgi:eukaryotic-like serine/threonine-protein kinase
MSLQTGQRLGGFEVLGPLGSGGMGEVYRARDTRLGREVALKVLPESLASDRDRLSRFEQEARAASALNHPNIVTIHEIGREGDATFIAMELVDGKTLRELTVSGPMPVKKVLNVAAQVSEGLAKAHGAGIVHRDLKPENVMVSKDGFVKILDFGLAKLIETDSGEVSAMPTVAQPETRPGTVMGTVGYMSPEQASGEPLDYRSDQFSLGSMVYEMLTGKKAFQRKTAAETMSAIIREEPEPAGKLRPDLPLPVRWILDRCMAKDPDDRYAATRDLARDLSGLRDHISEASSGGEALLTAPVKRRRRLSWVALALALVTAGLAGWWIARGFGATVSAAPTFRRLSFLRGGIGNARFAPDGQTVVYGAYQSESRISRLYLTRLESSESKPFEFEGDIFAISRSGELAIYQYVPQGRGDVGTLAVVPMAGGAPRPLVEDVAWAGADWDPTGKELAVARQSGGTQQLEFPIGKVLVPQGANSPRFSPDGREIAFWKEERGEFKLSLVDRVGGAVKTLSSGWKSASGVPGWRADGREVWFTASKAGGMDSLWAVRKSGDSRLLARVPGTLELYDVASDGRVLLGHHTLIQSLRGLVPGHSTEVELAWLDGSAPSDLSADGTTLLITESGEGAGSGPTIYLRTTDGAPAARIGEGDGIALSPDKKWVLARREEGGRRHFVLVPTGAGQARPLAFEGLNVGLGAFTPDSQRIVFTAGTEMGPPQLYISDVAGGKPRPIGPPGIGLQPMTSAVSPDGRRVVGVRGGKLVVVSIDGAGEPRELPDLLSPRDRAPQWTADSRSVYVYDQSSRPLKVEICDVESGKKRPWKQIPLDESLFHVRLRLTPDGRSYAYGARSSFSELYLVEGLR